MMAIYNFTALDKTNNTYEFVKELNLVTDPQGLMATSLLFTFGVVVFIAVKTSGHNAKVSFFVSSAAMLMVGILGVFAEFIGWNIVALPLVLFLASLIPLVMGSD